MTFTKQNIDELKNLMTETGKFTDLIFDWVAPLKRCGMLSTMYDFKAAIQYQIDVLENDYWTYQDQDGNIYENEFSTMKEACDHIDAEFAEACLEMEPTNAQTFNRDYELINFKHDSEGEIIEKGRVKYVSEYEHYHGDLAEHGTFHSGAGGVI